MGEQAAEALGSYTASCFAPGLRYTAGSDIAPWQLPLPLRETP